MQLELYKASVAAWDGNHAATAMRAAVSEAVKANSAADLAKAGAALDAKLLAVGGAAAGGRRGPGGGGFRRGGGPLPPRRVTQV